MSRFIRTHYIKQSLFLCVPLVCLGLASAQYYGGNPYANRPQPNYNLPQPAQNFSGFRGNPFANSTIPPTGMPIGTSHNFFGAGTVNPVASRPQAKPFSNVHIPGPLVTSRRAAQIEVERGLWGGGFWGY